MFLMTMNKYQEVNIFVELTSRKSDEMKSITCPISECGELRKAYSSGKSMNEEEVNFESSKLGKMLKKHLTFKVKNYMVIPLI
jgi:hypothetical protein